MLRKVSDVTFKSDNGVLTAIISGEVDHHGAKEVRYTIDAELGRIRPDKLCLDLSLVSFMDSSGLGLILGRYNKASELGIAFSVKDPSPSAARIIAAAGAGRIIKIENQNNER